MTLIVFANGMTRTYGRVLSKADLFKLVCKHGPIEAYANGKRIF